MHTAQAGEAPAAPHASGRSWSTIALISVVHGPDRLLARTSAKSLATDADPAGLATSWLDGRQVSIDRVIAEIGTRSFFAGPRVVVVSELFGAGSGGQSHGDSADSAGGRRGKASADLVRLFTAVPEDHHLILLEPDLSGPPAVLKTLPGPVQIVASEPPRGAALIKWIEVAARGAGAAIDAHAARQLAQILFPQTWERKPANPRYDAPPDLTLLEQEIAKLAVAAHPGPITASLIKALVTGNSDGRLFRFLEAAFAGDLRVAAPEFQRLQAGGEEPAALLAQLLGQIEIAVVAAAAGGRDPASVAKDLGTVTPGRISAATSMVRRTPGAAAIAVKSGTEVDRALKTGRIRRPESAVHDLMLLLASPKPRALDTR
jgi:DNA polymerase III delta subunit